MTKCNYKNTLIKALIIAVFTALIFAVPICAQAFDSGSLSENKPAQSGDPLYYADSANDSYWVVSENKWHQCLYDNSNYQGISSAVRQAMYNREEQYTGYFLVDKKAKADDISTIFNVIDEQVYEDDKAPNGGDYLEMMSTLSLNSNSRLLASSDDYDFYCISVDISNLTTKLEEDMISSFLEYFNNTYIISNDKIKNASYDDRQYYIVKTIYNFLAKHTVYDMDVYQGTVDANSERFRYSHTAYGTLFGNTEGAYNPKTFDSFEKINLAKQVDSQGLFRIDARNQGRSVCDGYSLVFYYLCKLNGIDCRIVTGDYVNGKESDPHAWNMVCLKDFNDADYIWYAVDATFGCQRSKKISNVFSIVDYSYFLRGTANDSFSAENHQQLFEKYQSINQSRTDYEFEIKSIQADKLYTVVSRRREADGNKNYVDTGEYNLEDYLIIAPDGQYYKLDKDNDYNFILSDGFTFFGSGYYYSCEFYDFAKGIGYTCNDKFIRDAGDYTFEIVTTNDNVIHKKTVTVNPLAMDDWSSYDSELTRYTNKAYFIGNDISFNIDIFDNSKTKLEEGSDYEKICYLKGDSSKKSIALHNPGEYVIEIKYKGNYSGTLQLPFNLEKADLSNLKTADCVSIRFGADIEKVFESLKIGDTDIYSGKDYKIDVIGDLNYGSKGKIVLTGLAGSKYVQEGSVSQWEYTVNQKYNISSLFDNNYITNAKYKYTGKEIKPADFTLSYVKSSTGQKINLVRGKDYVIKSYSNNIYAGTGKVNIEFIGNYTGTATMMFYIENGKLTITCSDMKYNGKSQAANPVVKVGDAVLKKGTDYTVSGKATNPGIYQGTIKGCGKFPKLSGSFVYYIVPNTLSGVKTSTTQSSVSVSWTKQGNNCTYEVWVYDTGSKGWKRIAQTGGSSYKITSVLVKGKKTAVKANTEYKIRVRAVISGKVNGKTVTKNGAVKELTVRTNPKKLSCKVSRSGNNALKLTWNKDTTVTGYQVQCSTSGNFKSGVKTVTISKNANYAYTFKNLKKGKTYYLRIRSYKKVGKTTYYSAYSSVVKIKL